MGTYEGVGSIAVSRTVLLSQSTGHKRDAEGQA